MSFLKLLQFLEERLGHQHVPLNTAAQKFPELLLSGAIHHDCLREIAAAIFKHNACRHPHDVIAADATLAALAPIRLKVLQSPHTDVDLFHFVENLCAATDAYFRESDDAIEARKPARKRARASVLPFKRTLRAKPREKSLA